MSDLFSPTLAIAAVKFKWQKDDRTYDYLIPSGLELVPGDKVIVETKRGETEVEVVAVKAESELAAKPILRRAPKPVEDWNF